MADYWLFYLVLMMLYFIPWYLALGRQHHNRVAICMLTLLGGWTGVGWLIALVWACTEVRQPHAAVRA